MQFSIGVEYALHCLLYLVDLPNGKSVGIKDLATYQGVSETYLSKMFTKLRKAGLVNAIPGVKGGYELIKKPEEITFWDVVEAIEGASYFFQCTEIRQREIILDINDLPKAFSEQPCLIKSVMHEAEDQMRSYLREKNLRWLYNAVENKVPKENRQATREWFDNPDNRDK